MLDDGPLAVVLIFADVSDTSQPNLHGCQFLGFLIDERPVFADQDDVRLSNAESPVDPGFVALWRGQVNLLPEHLVSYYGDIPEHKFKEITARYGRVLDSMTNQQNKSPQPANPDLQPYRDIVWKLTECFDAETLGRVLQD